jgi:phenylalanine-4-hydroxylase
VALSITAPNTAETVFSNPLFVQQKHDSYSAGQHATWCTLFGAIESDWARYASKSFLRGLKRLGLDPSGIPNFNDINSRLAPLTGFSAVGVGGYLRAEDFFACLASRKFPTSLTIRDATSLDYLPEPDIFHDVAGHVPMHTDPIFAETLVRFGKLASKVASYPTAVEALARFFWFTVEFGLVRERGQLKAYGSGLMSSAGELRHAVESQDVERIPFDLDRVLAQNFEIDHYQPVLFVIESYEQLYEAVGAVEARYSREPILPS